MESQDELMEMTKANLINMGEAKNPPLGLTMDDRKGDMVDKILAADGVPVASAAPSGPEGVNAKALPAHGALFDLQGNKWHGDYYQLQVMATELEKGPVEVTVNGWLIRFDRGAKVVLPEPYLDVLRKALVNHVVKDPDTGKEKTIDIMRYPMHIEGKCEGPTRVIL